MTASNDFAPYPIALFALITMLLCAVPPHHAANAYELLTAEEFAERSTVGKQRSLTVLANDGPEIIVHTPQSAQALNSPLDFDVEFRAREAAEPDINTLTLEYDLGLFWKDITSRLSEHAEITANRIVSRGAELPAGEHHLRMSISDTSGKTTTTKMVLNVAD